MSWSDALKAAALDAVTPDCGFVSGWGIPDEEMVELTSREAVTWAAAVDNSVAASNQPVLDVAGACEIMFIILFPAGTGGLGTDSAGHELSVPVEFTEAGTYTLTAMTMSIGDTA